MAWHFSLKHATHYTVGVMGEPGRMRVILRENGAPLLRLPISQASLLSTALGQAAAVAQMAEMRCAAAPTRDVDEIIEETVEEFHEAV
jgi:hypothetical protein